MSEARRDIKANLRGALAEAKDAIAGKRKLNTLDNLITELRETVDEGKVKGSGDKECWCGLAG